MSEVIQQVVIVVAVVATLVVGVTTIVVVVMNAGSRNKPAEPQATTLTPLRPPAHLATAASVTDPMPSIVLTTWERVSLLSFGSEWFVSGAYFMRVTTISPTEFAVERVPAADFNRKSTAQPLQVQVLTVLKDNPRIAVHAVDTAVSVELLDGIPTFVVGPGVAARDKLQDTSRSLALSPQEQAAFEKQLSRAVAFG